MKNIWIVITREYLTRVRKKSFLVMTLIAPLFLLLIASLPFFLSKFGSDQQKVAVIDKTGKYISLLQSTPEYEFFKSDKTLSYYSKLPEKKRKATAVVYIKKDLLEDPSALSIYSYQQLPEGLEKYIRTKIEKELYQQKLSSYKIPQLEQIVKSLDITMDIHSYKWDTKGDISATSQMVSKFIGLGFTFICYMFIFLYGQMVFSSVLEEKKNRIMELLISSVKPFEFMMGKIIGILFVGLTQLFAWALLLAGAFFISQILLLGGIYSTQNLSGIDPGQLTQMSLISQADMTPNKLVDLFMVISGLNLPELFLLFILYFIGGYLFYASIFAALGSMLNSEEDANQIMLPLVVVELFSFYAALGSMSNPEGDLAFYCSMIPLTSPVVMMVRLPYSVPLWQECLSIALLYLSFLGSTWVGAKIYRIGVLMYGKKPSLKDIYTWLRYY